MSATPPAPAGWYPDATNGNRMRYWDGTRWTEQFAAPVAPGGTAAQLKGPEGTDTNTPWIWVYLFLPFLGMIPVFFIDWSAFVDLSGNAQELMTRQIQALVSPAYVLSMLLGILSYAGTIVAAFLDHRELQRRGVPRPFHWAFGFLSYWVYGIGRGVVTNRRVGRGIVITWVSVGLLVLSFVLGLVLSFVLIFAVFSQIPDLMTYN